MNSSLLQEGSQMTSRCCCPLWLNTQTECVLALCACVWARVSLGPVLPSYLSTWVFHLQPVERQGKAHRRDTHSSAWRPSMCISFCFVLPLFCVGAWAVRSGQLERFHIDHGARIDDASQPPTSPCSGTFQAMWRGDVEGWFVLPEVFKTLHKH